MAETRGQLLQLLDAKAFEPGLPTLQDVKPEFEELAEKLGVR
jgi:hypothetical protein